MWRVPAVAALVASVVLLASCVERRERISVAPDGSMEMVVVHASDDPVDLLDGDAVPEEDAGWAVDLRDEVDENGAVRHILEARRLVLPGEEAPSRFGAPRDARADEVLTFPTTLRVERRRDGTWYHFRRVYPPRRWAELGDLAESPPAKRLQQLGGLDGPDVAVETLDQAARALVDLQVARTLLLARRAFLASAPTAPQDGWLRTRVAMERLAAELDARAVVEQFQLAMRIENEAKKAAAIQKALGSLEAAVDDRLQRAVREECGFGASELTAFLRSLQKERSEAAVTEDLADDSFEITVAMPGELMGTNGSGASVPGSGAASWTFKGDRLFDRPVELLISSRVAD